AKREAKTPRAVPISASTKTHRSRDPRLRTSDCPLTLLIRALQSEIQRGGAPSSHSRELRCCCEPCATHPLGTPQHRRLVQVRVGTACPSARIAMVYQNNIEMIYQNKKSIMAGFAATSHGAAHAHY